jgi:hypothetical protein
LPYAPARPCAQSPAARSLPARVAAALSMPVLRNAAGARPPGGLVGAPRMSRKLGSADRALRRPVPPRRRPAVIMVGEIRRLRDGLHRHVGVDDRAPGALQQPGTLPAPWWRWNHPAPWWCPGRGRSRGPHGAAWPSRATPRNWAPLSPWPSRAVPFWSSDLAVARHLPQGRSQAGTATSTSTETGTTSTAERRQIRSLGAAGKLASSWKGRAG